MPECKCGKQIISQTAVIRHLTPFCSEWCADVYEQNRALRLIERRLRIDNLETLRAAF